MKCDMSEISREKFKKIVREKRTTQKTIFKKICISESYANKCLKKGQIATKTIISLARELGVDIDTLRC